MECAELYYGLGYPKIIFNYYGITPPFAKSFEEMKNQYPLEQYDYVIQYFSSGSGCYAYWLEALVIDGDRLYFDDSNNCSDFEVVTCDENGYIYMAAVPKEIFENKTFSNVIYPNYDDQELKFSFEYQEGICDSRLFEIYGGDPYIVRSKEEYDEFMTEIRAMYGNISNPIDASHTLRKRDDYDGAVEVYIFYESDLKNAYLSFDEINVENGELILDYEKIEDPKAQRYEEHKTGVYRLTFPAHLFEKGEFEEDTVNSIDENTEEKILE